MYHYYQNTDGAKRDLKNYLESNKVDTKNFDLPKNLQWIMTSTSSMITYDQYVEQH